MFIDNLKSIGVENRNGHNDLIKIMDPILNEIYLYPNSINEKDGTHFFIAKKENEKFLFIITDTNEKKYINQFDGEILKTDRLIIKKCRLSNKNAEELQKCFTFTKPVKLGLTNSFGFGDRLGLANAGHIRALGKSNFKPVLAQQSIRELTRTKRIPADVLSAAVWAVFQEGFKTGFGADADHLKTTKDIDLLISNGFTMFTFDPGDHVNNEADKLNITDLKRVASEIPWKELNDSLENLRERYVGITIDLKDDFIIAPKEKDILRAVVKYGRAINHIFKMSSHLVDNYSSRPFEIEVSVDETESVTTPFEHYFIVSELKRLGVNFISLAPRFIGDFEKGIDYKGDIELFKKEYLKHAKIAEHFGSYKISLHSGSDKFGVYAAIGSLKRGFTHVKTAGTSYLEALKVIATVDKKTFREILDFACGEFDEEKASYHVSADAKNVKPAAMYSDDELVKLFEQTDVRQVLHVTFGKILTTKINDSEYLFRDKIFNCLKANEEIHYSYLFDHFRKHISPFEK